MSTLRLAPLLASFVVALVAFMAALLFVGPEAHAQQLIDVQQPEQLSGEPGGVGVGGTTPQPATDPGVSPTDEPLPTDEPVEQTSAPTPDTSDAASAPTSDANGDANSTPAPESSLGPERSSTPAQEQLLAPVQEQVQRTDEPVERTIEPVVDPVVGTVGQATDQPVTEPAHRKLEPVIEPVVEPVRQTVEPVVDQVGQTADPVIEPVARTVEPVRHAAGPVTEPVHQTIEPVVEPVRQTVEPTLEPVREAVGPAIEPVRQTVEPVQETATPVVEPVREAADPVTEPALQPVVGSPQGGPPQDGLPQGSVEPGPTEEEQQQQGALTPAEPDAALAPDSGPVPASGAPTGPAAAEPSYGVANLGSEPGLEEGVLRRDADAPADAPVASRPTDLSASLGTQQPPRIFDASLPAASSSSAASEGPMVSSNGRPVVGKQILGFPGVIEILDYTRLFASILADAYSSLSSTSAAGDALSPAPASGSPVPAAPASSAGLLGSAFGGSGFGVGGFLVSTLALLFVLSPAGGRILRSWCDFLRPTSALTLAIERPG